MEYTPQTAILLAGPIVTLIVAIGKKFGWVPDDRIVKQITALVVSCIIVMLWPILQGQPLPEVGVLLVGILQTWISSMASYSIVDTARKQMQGNQSAESPC